MLGSIAPPLSGGRLDAPRLAVRGYGDIEVKAVAKEGRAEPEWATVTRAATNEGRDSLLSLFPCNWQDFTARRVAARWLHKDKPAERFLRALLFHPRFGHSLRKTAARTRNAGYADLSHADLLKAGPAARAIRISVLEGAGLRCRSAVASGSRSSMPGPCRKQAGRGRCGPFTATSGWVIRSISVASERGPR